MATRFNILGGLPANGPMAVPFPGDGKHAHREGLVVQFEPYNKDPWIGNFQRGSYSLDIAILHPDKQHVVVIAGGNGYVVDPDIPTTVERMRGYVTYLEALPHLDAVLFGNDLSFEAWKASGPWWSSKRIAWDGMRALNIQGDELIGEAYSPVDDHWHPFKLDLLTGTCNTSTYESQVARTIPIEQP